MRTKDEILGETRHHERKGTVDLIAITTQLRILTEVLIDIRDIFRKDMDEMIKRAIKLKANKGGDHSDTH